MEKYEPEKTPYLDTFHAVKIDNLFLIGKCSPNVFKVNENGVIEYSRLRENMFDRIYKIMFIVIVSQYHC